MSYATGLATGMLLSSSDDGLYEENAEVLVLNAENSEEYLETPDDCEGDALITLDGNHLTIELGGSKSIEQVYDIDLNGAELKVISESATESWVEKPNFIQALFGKSEERMEETVWKFKIPLAGSSLVEIYSKDGELLNLFVVRPGQPTTEE